MESHIENELDTVLSLSEGWVNFRRFPCKEGHIDKWFGDCINNPNWPSKNIMQLNSSAEFYRFDNGKWISRYEFKNGFSKCLLEERLLFTSDEIFRHYYVNNLYL